VGGPCSMYEGEERRIQGFGGLPEENRTLGRPRLRYENKVKMNLQGI